MFREPSDSRGRRLRSLCACKQGFEGFEGAEVDFKDEEGLEGLEDEGLRASRLRRGKNVGRA